MPPWLPSDADALAHHTAAGTIATAIAYRHQQARAHAGLGRAHLALGDRGTARQHLEQALTHYTELGLPEAGEIRAHLDGLDGG